MSHGWSDRSARAAEIATRAFHHHQGLVRPVEGGLAMHLYNLMAAGKSINHGGVPSKRDLEYDSLWLQKPSAFISSHWCQLHHAFRDNHQWLYPIELTVWISTIAYSADHDDHVTQALLLTATSPVVAAAPLPSSDSHNLSKGYTLPFDVLEAAATKHLARAEQTDPKSQARAPRAERKVGDQLGREYGKDKEQAINISRDRLGRQWPCQAPKQPNDYHMEAYIDLPRAMRMVLPYWRTWWANKNFKEYLEGFVEALKRIPVETVTVQDPATAPATPIKHRPGGIVSAVDPFCRDAPHLSRVSVQTLESLVSKTGAEGEEGEKLTRVVDFLASKTNHESEPRSPEEVVNATLSETGYLPKFSPVFLLQQLRKSNWSRLSMAWEDAIVEYGLAVAALQRAKRLIRVHRNPVDVPGELDDSGHHGWSPHKHPEW